ncbi:MAG: hypothetical protein N838_00565 [Thiohalocapsa sp. PB-PSB1]|nr:MAG: hypothetical protein N838_00565 [Thiohalocapsa sp. PB-PSB1]
MARNARHHRRAAHLGLDDGAPHPSALHRPRRSLNLRWRTVQALSASRLVIPGQSAVQGLPRKLPRTPGARAYHRRVEDTAGHALRRVAQGTARARLGGLRQTPVRRPQQIIDYLGRYTHRIAISNHRILNLADGKVTFTWKDYKDGAKTKVMTLDANEFIRRFTLHILPPRFTRIRHYGLLACGHRATKLNRAKALLGLAPVTTTKVREPYDVLLQRLTGKDIHVCPSCGGRLRRQRDLAPTIGPARGQDPPLACEAA